MNKIFKILIGILFAAIILLIAFIIFFPFAYRMPKFPEQPKYSIAEKLFLEKLKRNIIVQKSIDLTIISQQKKKILL